MAQLIEHIVRHNITPANTASSPTGASAHSAQKPDFMEVRDRMRMLAGTMSHRMAIPKVTIDRKILEYKAAQVRGNVNRLEFEKREIQREIDSIPYMLQKTIWRGWVQHMEYRIRIIDGLLKQEITAQLNTIRTGRLSDAEAAVAEIAARWPYTVEVVTTVEEMQRIEAYIKQVGFHELQAAKDLIALRPDYQRKVVEQKAELARQQELVKQQEAEQQRQQEMEMQRQKEAEAAMQSVLPQGMQHEMIDVLGSSKTHDAVVQKLDAKIQDVLRQAELHDVLVHPELDWRLQSALKALPKSVNVEDFTFQLATIEHLVNDIHMQAAPGHKSLIERSPELLARAAHKYFEYLAPTETELALVVDLARYVSDVTTGTEYLSAEACEQRIAQFWQAIDSLSWKNISEVAAEQVIDSAAYVAARITYVLGARAAVGVVKDLKFVSAAAPRAAALFAERFVKVFDSVIGANPALVTNEGVVVWNASQEAAAEARQLVQAFNSMKDKPSGKPPAEILDDTDKVVKNEAKLESKSVGDLIKESKPGNKTKGKSIQYERPEKGLNKALGDFESLDLRDIRDISDTEGLKKIGFLEDGRMVIVRARSRSGAPTLEIQQGSKKIKLRY